MRHFPVSVHFTALLSTDLFKMKHQQYYDRRPSSVDAGTWYSAGSSVSGASVSGAAASSNYNYSSGGGGVGGGRRSSGVGLIGTASASGSVSIAGEDDDDRGEVKYSSARMSLLAGAPSPACGGGFGPYDEYNNHSDVHYGFQQSLVEKLYDYGNSDMGPMGMDTPPSSEEILMASRLPRNTSIFRSFEGWGFNAEDVYQMDPTEEKENEPATGFRFDSSIRKTAYNENEANNVAMTGVDPLDLMDASRTVVNSHPLPIPLRFNNRKRSSQIAFRDQQRRRRGSSLHSAHGHSRQHSRQNSRSANGSISEEGFTSSPYRPSIVLTEMPIFDFSESEPNTRNVSITASSRNGSIYGGRPTLPRGSVGSAAGSRRSSKVSKKSISSTAAVSGSPEEPEKKKSFFRFLSGRRSKPKLAPTSQARVPDTSFVPLLHDITEVSSVSSREATPELMTATETPLLKVERAADGKPRMLPVARAGYGMRRASVSLKMDDDDVFDNPAPVVPHRERRSSSVYSQHDLIPLRARQTSSVYDGEPSGVRRSSSVYDFESPEPGLRIRRTSSVYDIDNMAQPGEEPSPPSTPTSTWRRYSENHLSHPDVYVPPRANWYKSDWGLDDNKQLDADARSISSHATGAVKAVLSRQPGSSRRGSMDYGTYAPDTSGEGGGFNPQRRKSTDAKMADLSIALRNALKMKDILEEDEYYA
ncbi:hypothetical protein TWF191_007554 [Orbilia oligospora]|uniref:Uncharacterized protein n=2 Tax=Orbilia oligospora TaxID=2813651 RepID=A0A7C8UL83_ORBOL|nr:hypothetical protein TWF191_007554 [Orbilia oligospora]